MGDTSEEALFFFHMSIVIHRHPVFQMSLRNASQDSKHRWRDQVTSNFSWLRQFGETQSLVWERFKANIHTGKGDLFHEQWCVDLRSAGSALDSHLNYSSVHEPPSANLSHLKLSFSPREFSFPSTQAGIPGFTFKGFQRDKPVHYWFRFA